MICEEIIVCEIEDKLEKLDIQQPFDYLEKENRQLSDQLKQFLIILKKYKPHLQIISFILRYGEIGSPPYWESENSSGVDQFWFQVFDSQNMIHKLLKMEFYYSYYFDELYLVQKTKEHTKQKNQQNLIEKEQMIQIYNDLDVIIYNQYQFRNKEEEDEEERKLFDVSEFEMVDVIPLKIFITYIKKEEIQVIYKLISQYLFYLKFKYSFHHTNISIHNFFIQIIDQNQIKIKSIINTTQSIIYDAHQSFSFIEKSSHFELSAQLKELIQSICQTPLKESLKSQFMLLQKKIKIQKSNLTNEISSITPILIQYHGKDIFDIIQQHPKYNVFSIDEFGENYFILKIYDKNTKYLLKVERFELQSQANQIIEKYEQLKQFQSQNQDIFLKIGDVEVICVEQGWYVFIEEYLTEQKQNNKVIPLEKIDKIQFNFPQIDCEQHYIYLYLVMRNLKHFEQTRKYGFKLNQILNCKVYLMITDKRKLSKNKILYSNPFFLLSKQKDQELTLEFRILKNYEIYFCDGKPFRLIDTFNEEIKVFFKYLEEYQINNFQNKINLYEQNNQQTEINLEINLFQNQIQCQTLDQLKNKFKKIIFIFQQIEHLIQIVESNPILQKNDYLFDEKFEMYLTLNTNNLVQKKKELDQIINQHFTNLMSQINCLPSYLQYLSKINKIENIIISDDLLKYDYHGYNTEIEKSVNCFADIFQNLKRLQIDAFILNSEVINLNQLKQLKSLKEIKIIFSRYQTNCPKLFEIFEIFNNIKTFEKVKIDVNNALFFKSKDYMFQCFENGENEPKYQEEGELNNFDLMKEDVDRFLLFHNKQETDSSNLFNAGLVNLYKRYSELRFKSEILVQSNNKNQNYILALSFKNYRFGELKISYLFNDDNMVLNSINCKNQNRLICSLEYKQENFIDVEKIVNCWIKSEFLSIQFEKMFKVTPICSCDDNYQFAYMIYNRQKKLKSMTLYFYQQENCSRKVFDNFCNKVGLSDGNYFTNLLKLNLLFFSKQDLIGIQCIEKNLFNIINKNKSINTLKYNSYYLNTNKLRKLKRIVILEDHKRSEYYQ